MKAINIVLSILILLLSIAAAVFSYFLYEKRSQFTSGWDKMAEIVSESAKALDQGSGTSLSSKLTKDALGHRNYAKLDSLKGELPKQSRNIIKERDILANALFVVNNTVRPNNGLAKDKLAKLDTYYTSQRIVVGNVSDAVRRRDQTYRNLIAAVRSGLGVTVDNSKLLSGDASAFTAMQAELSAIRNRSRYYESSISQVGKRFGISAYPNAKNYQTEVRKVVSAVDKYQAQTKALNREIDALKRTNRSQLAHIGRLNNQIKGLKGVIADRDSQIVSFQRAFGLPESRGETKPWKPGSKEARALLTGKIIAVNSKYGYVAINIGKYSVVEQNIGNRTLEVNPVVEPGMVLAVSRKGADKSEFIARLQLSQVGETTSIANIPVDSKPLQVGDVVNVVIENEKAPEAPKKTTKR
ncbi:MAG: hypothetical protein IKB99_02170 [Lentisphaeria bacterium]|nr:hypothetical protein [Lentisphaeria bacterium]